VAFTITFPMTGDRPTAPDVTQWLTELGESFEHEGPHCIALRALPCRMMIDPEQASVHAWLDIDDETPVARLIDLVFSFSVLAGADVQLAGVGDIHRASLWLRLADEQDRVRICAALERSELQGRRDEVVQGIWALCSELNPGRDTRWDAAGARIVEMLEVGDPSGIDLESARWLSEDIAPGDLLGRPLGGYPHLTIWRWLSETYPGFAEP
jgi:hypothetical protein